MNAELKKFQKLLDDSLFSDNPWGQEVIEYRENLRAQILKLRNANRK